MSDAQALSIFVRSPVSQEMIHHLVVSTLHVLPCQGDKTQSYPSPPTSPTKATKPFPSLMTFISKLVRYTNVYTGTLMATLVYLNKLKSKLPQDAQGLPCTRHRIFLACLILSAKYHNDSSPKNKHWTRYTDGLFDLADVNLMERQLLSLLNWDLRVEEQDLIDVLGKFLEPIKIDLKRSAKIRKNLQRQRIQQSPSKAPVPSSSPPRYELATHSPVRAVTPSSSYSSLSTPRTFRTSSSSSTISTLSSISSSYDSEDNLLSKMPIQPTSVLPGSILKSKTLDPCIDLAAAKEEKELQALLNRYCAKPSVY